MSRFFHNELDTLRSHLLLMGEKAITALNYSITSLTEKDQDMAESVIRGDAEIDALEIAIDKEAIRYLSLRAPFAADLRLLTVAIKASHDLERVGDEARNMAKRSKKLISKISSNDQLLEIPKMAELAEQMMRSALNCFVQESSDKAKEILLKDTDVDNLNRENFKAFINLAKEKPEMINEYMDLIFISKSIERIADHATNLAEEVIYLTTAEDSRHQS